ncbi:hypothetical protein FB560_1834 [Microbacterium saperdae]|uniref:Uncharacterized protein n=1 Tax=Microbacterium saperdae TaxID=69368 RepID=A0A543BMX3_9MICO|nr:hypothetical protein FB560_1834 [Microbacterium saperdae]
MTFVMNDWAAAAWAFAVFATSPARRNQLRPSRLRRDSLEVSTRVSSPLRSWRQSTRTRARRCSEALVSGAAGGAVRRAANCPPPGPLVRCRLPWPSIVGRVMSSPSPHHPCGEDLRGCLVAALWRARRRWPSPLRRGGCGVVQAHDDHLVLGTQPRYSDATHVENQVHFVSTNGGLGPVSAPYQPVGQRPIPLESREQRCSRADVHKPTIVGSSPTRPTTSSEEVGVHTGFTRGRAPRFGMSVPERRLPHS